MSLAELANLALPASQRTPQRRTPQPANGLWTSRIPVLLPSSPIPGQHDIHVSSPSSPSLFPRNDFGLCVSKSGDVYFYGGETEGLADELYRYSITDNTVTPLRCYGPSPGARRSLAMTLVGDVIALHGGANGNTGMQADASLYLLNLVSREWSRISVIGDAPGARQYHSMATVATTIYMFAGATTSGSPVRYQRLNELWAFDLTTLRTRPMWRRVKLSSQEQPSERSETQIVPYQNQLILFGGCQGDGQYLNDTWSFDVKSRSWSELQCTGDIPPPQCAHASSVLDDVIYVTGGLLHSGLCDVFALRVSDQRWFRLNNTPTTPNGCDYHAAAQIGTSIFIFGGRSRQEQFPKEPIHILNINCINNPDLHSPERLKELEAGFQGMLMQSKLGSETRELENEAQIRRVEAQKTQNQHQNSAKCATDLCAELLKEQVDAKTVVLIKELSTEVGDLEKRMKELESEIRKSFRRGQIVSSLLESPSKMDTLTHIQGENAQTLADFLAEVLEHQDLLESHADGRRILHFLSKLAKSTHIFPRRAELSNVQCDLTSPANDEGGYGLIYKGVFQQQPVCVKAVRVLDYGAAGKALRAQAGELVLLAHVSHPNVIPLYGAYLSREATPRICIVSPWMENGNLASYLKRYPNTAQIPLMSDVAVGLEFLHDMGIIHADLKAHNILVSRTQRAMLADFGISTVLSTNVGTTTAKDFAGTVFWMAPEQLVPDDEEELSPPTQHSDMWGFACICYEVLTGEIPFARYYRPQQLISAFMKGHATPLRPKRNSDPTIIGGGSLVELAGKCWNYDPSQRPTAAEAVRFLDELNVQDDRPSMGEELAMFENVKNSRAEVEVDYAHVLSIVRQK